jgi:hypothetical protein
MDEQEERLEAAERASAYYERHEIEDPPHDSEEWRDQIAYYLERIREN